VLAANTTDQTTTDDKPDTGIGPRQQGEKLRKYHTGGYVFIIAGKI